MKLTLSTHLRTYIMQTALVLGLAVSTLVVLLFIEGVPGRFAVHEAQAWHCVEMTVHDSSIEVGESTTLVWNFAADANITVTIDGMEGQSWTGVSGSTSVSPTQSTTYTARAHKVGSDATFTCSVYVQVVPPTPTDPCEDVALAVDDAAFTWNGEPYLDSYTVTYCDGTNTGVVNSCWETDARVQLNARIKSVSAQGGSCHREVTQSCPTPPPVEEPEWPACPFTESANTSVVEFDGKGIVANGSEADAKSNLYAVSLPAGTYTLKSASWDGYSWRASDEVQPYEQWKLAVRDTAGTLYTSPATTDLADGVNASLRTDTLSDSVVLSRTATEIQAVHAAYPYESRQSVQPVCVAFVRHEVTPDPVPACSLSVSSASVSRDDQVTLTWSGGNVTSASIDQGIGAVSVNGSRVVSIPSDVTYTGTFFGNNGQSVTCSTSVSIQRSGGGGSCMNCKNTTKKPIDKPKDVEKEKDDPSPKIVLSKTITKAGNYISLDQVPYTGFEASPMVTMLFWLTVLGVSAVLAYIVTVTQPIARMRNAFALVGKERAYRAHQTHVSNVVEETRAVMNSALPTVQSSISLSATLSDGVSSIEDRAHADSILLSPEATRMISTLVSQSGVSEGTILDRLFNLAKDTYPREDGWILLSKERAQSLLAQFGASTNAHASVVAATSAPVTTTPVSTMQSSQERPFRSTPPTLSAALVATPAPVSQNTRTETGTQNAKVVDESEALAQFLSHLVAGEQQKTFEILRSIIGKGIAAETFIAQLVRKLDDIYKNRLEGNHNPDQVLAAKTATWSNGDFEKVLGILVECIDFSYSSTRIGTKVALAKAFEYFAQKQS